MHVLHQWGNNIQNRYNTSYLNYQKLHKFGELCTRENNTYLILIDTMQMYTFWW